MKNRVSKILEESQTSSETHLQCKMLRNGKSCHTREKSLSLWDCNHIRTETKRKIFLAPCNASHESAVTCYTRKKEENMYFSRHLSSMLIATQPLPKDLLFKANSYCHAVHHTLFILLSLLSSSTAS